MSLFGGIRSGINPGIHDGINMHAAADAGAAVPIAEFDFSAPVAAYDFSNAYAAQEWTLSGPTASSYANGVGSATLDNNGGLEDQMAAGVYNGSDLVSINAWEGVAGEYLLCSDDTIGDFTSTDFACVLVFRAVEDPGAARRLASKLNTGRGWEIQISNTSNARFRTDNGIDVASNLNGSNLPYFDGALHYIAVWYDQSTDTKYMTTDLESEVSETGKHPSGDDFSAGATGKAFAVNAQAGGGSSGMPGIQFLYVGLCSGANSETFYDTHIAAWDHATDPSGLLETATRACSVGVPVSATAVGHFSTDQLPIGFHSAFTSGYGLYCNSDLTNLLTYSELLSNWTNKAGTPTVTDRAGNAPDGFERATSITAGANNDQQGLNFTTSAGADYTLSIWIKRNGGSDVTGRLIFYDETGAAELSAQAFTATSAWQIVTVTATTNGGQVSSSIRVEVDTSAESVFAWGAMAIAGTHNGECCYIRTEGATASLTFPTYERATEDAVTTDVGELLMVWAWAYDAGTGTRRIFSQGAASLDDRRSAYIDNSETFVFQIDLGGTGEDSLDYTTAHDPLSLDTEYTTACQWGDTTETRIVINGTAQASANNMPFEGTATGSFESIAIGTARSQINAPDAFIQSILSYDETVT